MPQYTVLAIVKDVLNEGDMDTVSTWDETIESEQVGDLIETVFYEFHSDMVIPATEELENPGAATGDNYYLIPTDVSEVYWIQDYPNRNDLIYLEPKLFLTKLPTSGGADIADPNSGVTLHFGNSAAPSYWTSFDDQYICIDSIDTTAPAVTDLLMRVVKEPSITIADGTIPDIPNDGMALFAITVKVRALLMLNQEINPLLEQQRRKLEARFARRSYITDGEIRTSNKGRKTRSSRRNVTFTG